MKTINKVRLIIIGIIMLIAGLTTSTAQGYGQKYDTVDDADYMYLDFSFDGNGLFLIKDNPRMEVDIRTFDWDFEAGAREDNIGVYIFYGQANELNYKNYGAGVDYYLRKNPKGLDISAGIYYSEVIRQDYDGNYGSFTSWLNPRIRANVWLNNFGINLTVKGQGRYDIGKTVWELAGGLTYKFDR